MDSSAVVIYIEAESAMEFVPPMAAFEDDLNAWDNTLKPPAEVE